MVKTNPPLSFGFFKPVGHTVIACPCRRLRQNDLGFI